MKKIDTRPKNRLSAVVALTCGLAAWLVASAAVADSRRATSSRSHSGSGSKSVSSVSQSARAVPRAGSTRSGGSSRSYSTRHHYRGRSHGFGLRVGYYGYFGLPHFYYPSIYGPYYPYGYGYGYGYPEVYGPRLAPAALGALDLSIRPKKVEVWVDGQYLGTAGKFDGYPGYLWLPEGEHELVFYRDGYETVVRQISVLPGNVAELAFDLVPGESRLPQDVMTPAGADEPVTADRDVSGRAALDDGRSLRRDAVPDDAADLDLRESPGSFALDVAPVDASVYLDGRFLGTAAELAKLHAGLVVDPGEHRLEVVRPGYASRELPFVVGSGERVELAVELEEL